MACQFRYRVESALYVDRWMLLKDLLYACSILVS